MQKKSTQKMANSTIREYKKWATGKFQLIADQQCLNAYKLHLLAAVPKLAPGTIKTKFMHISKWVKEAYGKKVFTGWFKGS